MSAGRFIDRLAALSGVLSVVLSLGGFMLIGSGGFATAPGATLDEIASIVARVPPAQVFIGLYLDMFGSLAFVVFVARVWKTLRRAEQHPAWVSAWALGAGLLAVAATLIDKALFFAIFTRAGRGLDPGVAAALFDAAGAGFALFGMFAGLFLGGVAIVVLRSNVLPRWLGWLAAVAAVLSMIGPASPVGPIAFPLLLAWIVAASVFLFLEPPAPVPSSSPQAPWDSAPGPSADPESVGKEMR
jgi:hypothetical protein